jgi:hypothetical protein
MTASQQTISNELERALISNSAFAPPSHILEGIDNDLPHKTIPGAPQTIYAELWHITFWQQVTLEWIEGIELPYPEHASLGFPTESDIARETWQQLCERFFAGNRKAGAAAVALETHDRIIHCPSPPDRPARTMTIREQLESLAAHNGYHFGRIVLLRQLNGAWPPPSGGDTW